MTLNDDCRVGDLFRGMGVLLDSATIFGVDWEGIGEVMNLEALVSFNICTTHKTRNGTDAMLVFQSSISSHLLRACIGSITDPKLM